MRWASDLGDLGWPDDVSERLDQGTQKLCKPTQEQAEVVAGGGEDGIDAVAVTALEMIAVHAVLGLEVTDHGR